MADGLIETGAPALVQVVEQLCAANDGLARRKLNNACRRVLPSRDMLGEIMESLRSVLFPGYFGTVDLSDETMRFHVGSTLDKVVRVLLEQVKRGLCFICNQDLKNCPQCEADSQRITHQFISALPVIRAQLAKDVHAAYEGDPAATCPEETIFAYPGLMAITNYRIAHQLFRLDVPIIPRIVTELAHSATGIDIHPGATIGSKFFIDHGTGIVIGETCEIGDRVRIYQGVTLGAKSFQTDDSGNLIKGVKRHPVIEDDVVIYSGATVLGRVRIGHHSVIGGNVWLVNDLEPHSRVTQSQARKERFDNGAGI